MEWCLASDLPFTSPVRASQPLPLSVVGFWAGAPQLRKEKCKTSTPTAAKIKFNKKSGHYEIESYGNHYIKAVNVRPWK